MNVINSGLPMMMDLIPNGVTPKTFKLIFSAQHAVLRRKSKDWLAWNRDNVSVWADMSIHRLSQLAL